MDIGTYVLQLHEEGLTPRDMLEQKRINMPLLDLLRVYRTVTDTRLQAKSALQGAALDMAHNIIENGQPKDHIAALKGLHVLEDEVKQGLTVIIGAGSAVQINLGTASLSPLSVTDGGESV